MQAYMRDYLRVYKTTDRYRAYENAYRAELRRRGLCLECAAISVKYLRCVRCRARAQANKRARRIEAISLDPISRIGVS